MIETKKTKLHWVSSLGLSIARILPRGGWRLVKLIAERDPSLQDVTLPLIVPDGECIRVDMRETVSMNFLRYGLIPGQRGHAELLRSLLRPGDVCFDVGANVGYMSILVASLVGPTGRVIALEPGDRAFAILQRNAERRPTIHVRKLGASAQAGSITFYESPMSDVSSIVKVDGARQITIETIALDDLTLEEGCPQFVKIDVEGHEPAVFRGMQAMLRRNDPPIVLFEALGDAVLKECIAVLMNAKAEITVRAIARDGSLSDNLGLRETADFVALPAWALDRLG